MSARRGRKGEQEVQPRVRRAKLTVGGSVQTSTSRVAPGLLSKTRVASPKLHLDTVTWVGSGIKTVVGASELDETIAHEVPSLGG